jgi:hypothetical protein
MQLETGKQWGTSHSLKIQKKCKYLARVREEKRKNAIIISLRNEMEIAL